MIMQEVSTQSLRRNFLKSSVLGLATVFVLPALGRKRWSHFELPSFRENESYWEMVKAQFAIPTDLIMANSANLCSAPHSINSRVQHFITEMNQNVSFQNREIFEELRKTAINKVAHYLGVAPEEVGITRNTTEGNNIILNGLELKKGDEVILWDQNHPSNRESWENRARRIGFKVIRISVPTQPAGKDDMLKPFVDAITGKTRLIAFSHISNVSGIALPVKELCQLARNRNVLTLIDGAQACGFLDLDLNEIGCDFYTTSTHKWMLGPFENGILYIRKERIMDVWPDRVTVGWNSDDETVDGRFCAVGQRNETTPPAIIEMIDFHQNIGKQNIERRIRDMADHLKLQIREKLPSAEFVTPLERELSGGVTIIQMPGKDGREIYETLYRDYGIACAPTGGIRFSPTISATMSDMNKIVNALVDINS